MTTITPFTAEQAFDGSVADRVETARFDVYEGDEFIGHLAALHGSATVTNDASRGVRRSIGGLKIPGRPLHDVDTTRLYAEDLDVVRMNIRAWWCVRPGVEYPLGVFGWADDSQAGGRADMVGARFGSLVDRGAILDQSLYGFVSRPDGTPVGEIIADVLDTIGVYDRSVENTIATLGEPVAWVPGRDSWLGVLESLFELAGFLPPHFDSLGVFIGRTAPTLETATPDRSYSSVSGTVALDSVVSSNDLLRAPNLYIVVDTSSKDSELVGRFEVPVAAPHSYANRGYYIVSQTDVQGLDSQYAADQAAAAAYARDGASFSWLSFEARPDPRHDTFDVVAFDDVNYLEIGWSLPLASTRMMAHDLQRVFAE